MPLAVVISNNAMREGALPLPFLIVLLIGWLVVLGIAVYGVWEHRKR